MRILLIEDDPMIGKSLVRALRDQGMSVDWTTSDIEGEEALAVGGHALVLLDLGLPGKSGLDVLRTARAAGNKIPVVVLTARDDLDNRIAGLDLGADDYITKPFEVRELVARMRAVMRRQSGSARSVLEAGGITLDMETHEVAFRGNHVLLPAREFALMRALMDRPGAILSREQIEKRLYGWGEEAESNAVDVLIHSVRKKFDKDIIQNVRGDDHQDLAMNSLRNTALVWMTSLLTVVGILAVVISYQLARNEAAGFLDSQLRQIALNAGQGLVADAAPPAVYDPEDDFAIQIWDAPAKKIRNSSGGIEVPLQASPGFATISASGEEWRVYIGRCPTYRAGRTAHGRSTGARRERCDRPRPRRS
ncbi:MAG: hypothetical protein CFE29_28900 [Bradyrhizobiaceae bacterium PARB1]|jgi:two-component system OmpR family response regulator|uniref:Response regulator transcription factor n=1 Tax=Bradyrhizobium betae TaxID=244734 RepID=A0A5P6PH43_9BRAD|nr:response regulator [Bradyrhizobium sp.]OYU86454.1 MAG: hypothetical protein CFE29_28900 [Bradyrhizobiaceae bacterium PARB1]QFI77631.1 response regulator transcription factor [Bradyrhizobium betae]